MSGGEAASFTMLIKDDIQGLQQWKINIAINSLSYGTYFVLLVSACLIFLKRGSHWVKSHSFVICMTACTALTTTALACLVIRYYFIGLRWYSGVPQVQAATIVPRRNIKIAIVFLQRLNAYQIHLDYLYNCLHCDGGRELNLTMTLPLLFTNMISTLLIGFQMNYWYYSEGEKNSDSSD
ncbi:hypothetical protein K435DRAFT_925884 [Dendrothele bispora CBS 962.96]|uniref:Uncharacterized protein n=1 Tax=Dendrothele bispora (strain CBS 962.96) TaxID=1314807 RepID=A0A4S8L9F0_DENBC|nr:hypothetical protein K435DRAFT_925884 [Dendrothele bispora CBS 962.96]